METDARGYELLQRDMATANAAPEGSPARCPDATSRLAAMNGLVSVDDARSLHRVFEACADAGRSRAKQEAETMLGTTTMVEGAPPGLDSDGIRIQDCSGAWVRYDTAAEAATALRAQRCAPKPH